MMDIKLSEFIAKTSCEPGVAQDLLNYYEWNLSEALNSFYRIKNIDIVDSESKEQNSVKSENVEIKVLQRSDSKFPTDIRTNGSSSLSNPKDIFLIPNKCTSEPSLSSQSSDCCDSSVLSTPTKLPFKYQRNDLFPDKKLSRGISRASDNENLISKARSEVAEDFKTSSRGSRLLNMDNVETPEFTFTLPDIYIYHDDFSEFLKRDLIEKSTLSSLQSSKRLNWWSGICNNFYPLVTSGDGNCLLHAASLGMWGFHDRELTLRKALYFLLKKSPYTQAFYRRWRWQTHFQNSKAGLIWSESEWEQEWENILRMASTEPRSKGNSDGAFEMSGGKKEPNDYEEKSYIYESLEEIHIFVLAHVLRRPIIVIADTMLKDSEGKAFYPILFGGIYLPLECSDDCLKKSPLCLTYDAAHFSALVVMNKENVSEELPSAIPLMDVDHNILPLHFAIDPGEVFTQKKLDPDMEDLAKTFILTEQDKIELLKKYFDILTLAHKKDNCIEKEIQVSSPKIIEKSQTLPSDFSYAQITDKSLKNSLGRSAAKQLLQRPFVTFGRMGKRIKKNLGQIARRSTSFKLTKQQPETKDENIDKQPILNEQKSSSKYLAVPGRTNDLNETANEDSNNYKKESIINTDNSIFYCDTYVLAAKLYTNKHLYYDDIIKNYLSTAKQRFSNEQEKKKIKEAEDAAKAAAAITATSTSTIASSAASTSSLSSSSSSSSSSNSTKLSTSQLICVNGGCSSSASASTNYLCTTCFDEQKQVLLTNDYQSNTLKESSKNSKIVENNKLMESTKSSPELNNINGYNNVDEEKKKMDGEDLKKLPNIFETDDDEIDKVKKANQQNNNKNTLDMCITNM